MVRRHKLHRFADKDKVREAILSAEAATQAPIYVSISPYFWGSVRRMAERVFRKHGGKGVLLFVVPSRRQFAVIGDPGVHENLGQETWDAAVAAMQVHFARGDGTAALVQGIEDLGRELARHYPRSPKD